MTATLPPPLLRTLAETRELPTPSDAAGWTAGTVWGIALFRERHVDPAAHRLAHPAAVHGCPFCPPATGEVPVRSSEAYVRELAERRPTWSGTAA